MAGSQPLANKPNASVRATKKRGGTKPHELSKNQFGLQTNCARISKSNNPNYGQNGSYSFSSFLKEQLATNTVLPVDPHGLTSEQQGFIAKRAELAAIETTAVNTIPSAGGKPDDNNSPAPRSGILEHTPSPRSLTNPNTARQSTWTTANGCEFPVWLRVDKYSKLTRKDNSWAMSAPKLVFRVVVYENIEPAVKDGKPGAGKKPAGPNKAKRRTPAASTGKRAPKTTGTKATGARGKISKA